MLTFLVLVFVTAISCEHFDELGLHFDYNTEYAPQYDSYKPRDYHFNYAVSDPHTGDHKSQWEVRENGVVRGGYSLLEPDGTTRIVEYIADEGGFRAVVKKIGTALYPEHVETLRPIIEQAIPETAHYRTYDGQISNYANTLDNPLPHVEPLLAEIPRVAEIHDDQHPTLVHPIPYQIQKPSFLYQHQQIYPGTIEVHQDSLQDNNQYLLVEPKASGYGGEVLPVIPIAPTYHTTIEYHGLTGNLEDDTRYNNAEPSRNYEYQGDYSERVHKVVRAPVSKGYNDMKSHKSTSQQFIIYYPDQNES
ncbi:uncharacterized protein BDFB_003130 [Asbolus verrucosus]|uniref:Chitin bind 4 domain containing protein n=1 Tax=Asbolus verrucosus TaxID=1661398 RepID=A0A482V7M2_ASBVE|nr:uncharacterized protein BDFB_003130 [Asbolus verrucosus]